MKLELPKNVFLGFAINVYNDMEFAEEIEYSNSYTNYENAKSDYEIEKNKANGNYFVELIARIEIEQEDGRFETNERQLAHNFSKDVQDGEQ